MTANTRNWVVFGFKNCGKTTIGQQLAYINGRPFVDIDDIITAPYPGYSCTDLYQQYGEEAFRALDRKAALAAAHHTNTVVATGGSTVLDPISCQALKDSGILIYLKTDFSVVASRILTQEKLPAFVDADNPEESLRQLYDQRCCEYQRHADITLEITNY